MAEQGKPQRAAASEVVQTSAPTGALAQFHDDSAREVDFQEFMEGTPHAQGGQHDMAARGMTTDRGEWQQSADGAAQPLFQDPATYVQDAPQPAAGVSQPPEQDFRRLYGQSENEKGTLRKSVQELQDALSQQLALNERMMQQFNSMAPQAQQAPQYGGYPPPAPYPTPYDPQQGYTPQPAQGYSYAPPTIPGGGGYSSPQLPPRFLNKDDNDMALAGDIEGVMRGVVAPAYYAVHQDTQAVRQEVAQLRAMHTAAEKDRRGITTAMETQALMERPWIRNLQHNPQAYLGALGDYADAKRAAGVVQRVQGTQVGPQQVPQAYLPGTAASAARRVTYIEGGANASAAEHSAPASAFDKEIREAMAAPHHLRATRMREVMARHGIQQVNDWRDPAVTTR